MNVDVEIEVKPAEGTVRFDEPAGFRIAPELQSRSPAATSGQSPTAASTSAAT